MADQTVNALFLLPLIITALAALGISPLIIRWYKGRGWVDDPSKNRHPKVVHTYPVPRGGGLVIFVAFLVGVGWFLGLDKHLLGIILGASIIAVLGFVDDVRDLNPYWRLFWGIIAAGCVVAGGIGIAFITNPLGAGVIHLNELQIPFYLWGKLHTIWVWSDLFALIWIVWCMNMMNNCSWWTAV